MGRINGSSWAAGFHSHGDNGFQVERSALNSLIASHRSSILDN